MRTFFFLYLRFVLLIILIFYHGLPPSFYSCSILMSRFSLLLRISLSLAFLPFPHLFLHHLFLLPPPPFLLLFPFHANSAHLSITFFLRPESLYLLFLSSLSLPSLCLSFSPRGSSNGMTGGWAVIRSSAMQQRPLSPPTSHHPPAAIHHHQHTLTGKPQTPSAFQTYAHTLTLNAHTKVRQNPNRKW